MPQLETFVVLAPEFGGTQFGPFKAMEIRLGSDPTRNDIVLPEALGVLPEHVKIISQGDAAFILAPSERTAGVWLYRPGQRSKQVTTPVAIAAARDTYEADGFSLVSPEGPKFFVIQTEVVKETYKQQGGLGRAAKQLTGKSLLAEIRRAGMAAVITSGVGGLAYRGFAYVKTGAFLRPRNIITGVIMVMGFLAAGGSSVVACNMAVAKNESEGKLDSCNNELSAYRGDVGGAGGGLPSLEQTTANILGNEGWKMSLAGDAEFRTAYLKHLKNIMTLAAIKDRYRWTYSRPNSSFASAKRSVGAQLPAKLGRILPFAAAYEGPANAAAAKWSEVAVDALGEPSCGRGALGITWRMGKQLGLSPLQLDHRVASNDWTSSDVGAKRGWMASRAQSIRNTEPPDTSKLEIDAQPTKDQGVFCAHVVGDDVRIQNSDLGTGLKRALASNKRLPDIDDTFGIIARLVRFYAADYEGDFTKLDFSEGIPPSVVLDKTPGTKAYAVEHAALVAARATAIPCLAVLDRELEEPPEHLSPLPSIQDCIVLSGGLLYDQYQ